jgi:hypothetical protein
MVFSLSRAEVGVIQLHNALAGVARVGLETVRLIVYPKVAPGATRIALEAGAVATQRVRARAAEASAGVSGALVMIVASGGFVRLAVISRKYKAVTGELAEGFARVHPAEILPRPQTAQL